MDYHNIELQARSIRGNLLQALLAAGSGHTAGSLGFADVLAVLYGEVIQHKPENPNWEERDRFVLSCGHLAPLLYATLAENGYFSVEELWGLRQFESGLEGHPHYGRLPGIEATTGSLGQGISQALGMAIGAKIAGQKWRVYCAISDGELQEGQTQEAIMYAGAHRLSNFTLVIDRNNIQISGTTEDVLSLEPLSDKLASFGFRVLEIDGHEYQQIYQAFMEAKSISEKPCAIIAHTIAGKGVAKLEGKSEWHGKVMSKEETELALAEIRNSPFKYASNV